MVRNAQEIIEVIGSPAKAARFFEVKPPSVREWQESGRIPEDRLIRYAARLEAETRGVFSRYKQWPDTFRVYWPELKQPATIAQAATQNVAESVAQ